MAVTIEDLTVEVQPAAKPEASSSASSGVSGKRDIDLQQALQILHVRQHRLKAD